MISTLSPSFSLLAIEGQMSIKGLLPGLCIDGFQ